MTPDDLMWQIIHAGTLPVMWQHINKLTAWLQDGGELPSRELIIELLNAFGEQAEYT